MELMSCKEIPTFLPSPVSPLREMVAHHTFLDHSLWEKVLGTCVLLGTRGQKEGHEQDGLPRSNCRNVTWDLLEPKVQ